MPRKGPSILIAVFVVPFQMAASTIAPDMVMGEIVFWLLIVGFWTVLSYVLLYVLWPFVRQR
jgi:hypothetical protein